MTDFETKLLSQMRQIHAEVERFRKFVEGVVCIVVGIAIGMGLSHIAPLVMNKLFAN